MKRRNALKMGAVAFGGMVLATKAKGLTILDADERNNFWEVITNRRSVRSFKNDAVTEKDLLRIIDAARMAPTAGNQQPWKFLLVQDKQQIAKLLQEKMLETKSYFQNEQKLSGEELENKVKETENKLKNGYLSAPAFIVVLTDQDCKYPSYTSHDGPLAAGYLMLAARALGYGSVYITDAISEEATRKAFNIPMHLKRVCITPIGIPNEWPTKEKKELDSFIVKDEF